MTIQALPYILLLGFLYGSSLVASRFSVGQFSPTTYIGLRLTMASLGYCAFYLFSRRQRWPTDGRIWRHGAVLGLFGTAIPMTTTMFSLQLQSAGITSILTTVSPAITMVIAHFSLADERLSWRKIGGVLLALSGAMLLALRGETGLANVGPANPLGYTLVLVAMVSGSISTVYARRFMRNLNAFDVGSTRMITAMCLVMPLSLWLVGFDLSHVTQAGYLGLFYATLTGTFWGMLLSFYIIKRFGATAGSLQDYVMAVFATLGGILVLGEQFTPGMLGGMSLIVLGIALINRRGRAGLVAELAEATSAQPVLKELPPAQQHQAGL